MDARSLPLCSSTALRLLLDESMKRRQSDASYEVPIIDTKPPTSQQYTNLFSAANKSTNCCSRCLYHEKVVPGAKKFLSLSLEPRSSADSFDKFKSLTK